MPNKASFLPVGKKNEMPLIGKQITASDIGKVFQECRNHPEFQQMTPEQLIAVRPPHPSAPQAYNCCSWHPGGPWPSLV